MTMKSLRQLFDGHRGRPIGKIDHFFDDYEVYLAPLRRPGIRVLEIGVYGGGSLELWQRYFGPGTAVHGVDIDPGTLKGCPEGAQVHIGCQTDREFLVGLVSGHGPFDLVVDDGSHQMGDQIASFEILYPTMSERGVYICEDAFTSYWEEYGGGLGKTGTFMEFAKGKVDELHACWSEALPATDFSRGTRSIAILSGAVIFQRGTHSAPRYVSRTGERHFSQSMEQLREAGLARGVSPRSDTND